ncbi:TetR/AcrR family transcriptional regulator [Klugiella xanthotipulae]|uniref:TetR family transcriptional regulator n=1 Tax=Klugiella xanthotipulae TaxID=244735 RepID=A0A543HSK1_9MICO|nr:TetR/AcrR family transcriptional regulator [Klugiella xanthotipulae]TQM61300.1 TetR family transcriptional regulator [Klugiella xanthotipulae]
MSPTPEADPEATTQVRRGRPRVSSRDVLEDAACELFIEKGYAGTTIDHITQRAGVSRGTFFNYFTAKGDVFWVHVDDSLAHLSAHLAATSPEAPVMHAISEALTAVAQDFGPRKVPWILTQYPIIGSVHELQASALTRLISYTEILRAFAATRLGPAADDLTPRLMAYSAISALVAAAQTWATAGSSRGSLVPYVESAMASFIRGFNGEN